MRAQVLLFIRSGAQTRWAGSTFTTFTTKRGRENYRIDLENICTVRIRRLPFQMHVYLTSILLLCECERTVTCCLLIGIVGKAVIYTGAYNSLTNICISCFYNAAPDGYWFFELNLRANYEFQVIWFELINQTVCGWWSTTGSIGKHTRSVSISDLINFALTGLVDAHNKITRHIKRWALWISISGCFVCSLIVFVILFARIQWRYWYWIDKWAFLFVLNAGFKHPMMSTVWARGSRFHCCVIMLKLWEKQLGLTKQRVSFQNNYKWRMMVSYIRVDIGF